MYLFDTDILSAVAKKRRPADLVAKLERTPQAAQFTSAVNVAEIYFGIFRMGGPEKVGGAGAGKNEGRRETPRDRLLKYVEEQIFARLTILPFDRETAVVYGKLRAALERKGRPRFEPDLQIAAIGLQHGLTVVTGNVRHFSGIPGLRVENWLA
jgi:tRNA(fMet)-specific endonuclease VapC